jgi:hypothetical protein
MTVNSDSFTILIGSYDKEFAIGLAVQCRHVRATMVTIKDRCSQRELDAENQKTRQARQAQQI